MKLLIVLIWCAVSFQQPISASDVILNQPLKNIVIEEKLNTSVDSTAMKSASNTMDSSSDEAEMTQCDRGTCTVWRGILYFYWR